MEEYFERGTENPDASFVRTAESFERSARIENHPFFETAKHERKALVLWASQEAIVTNPFSQILFHVLGNIKNVHIRSMLLPVVHGEHSAVRNGVADRSHPWLIWRLCRSLGLSERDIKPTKAIVGFLRVLESAVADPMRALGILGIGNELMLLAEYRAVEACFDSACPEADYRDFFEANIGEDETHTKLIGAAAAAMAALGADKDAFLDRRKTRGKS